MRQWWNKLPMYDKEGRQGGRPLVVINDGFGRRGKPHQEELDDDDDPPIAKKGKKGGDDEFEEVTIDGKKFKVQKGAGEVLNKLTGGKGVKTQAQDEARLRQMLESLLDERIPKGGKKSKKVAEPDDVDEDEDDDALLFTDPKAWKKKFAEGIRKEVMKEVGQSYNADQSQRTFWNTFYSKNEDLQDYDFIVKAVLQENLTELGQMEIREGSKKLAEYVREKIVDIAKKTSKGKSNGGKFHVEGGGSARLSGRGDEGDDDDQEEADRKAGIPMTLGAMLKARREQRRKPRSQAEE